MSWFFVVSKHSASQSFPKVSYESEPLFTLSFSSFELTFGGVTETCLYEHDEVSGRGWGVVGVGILHEGGRARIMANKDWRVVLEESEFNLNTLDGHFVALRWDRDQIEFFSDQIGLRTLYYSTAGEGIAISTRLDWISVISKSSDLNIPALGSSWLMLNQLSFHSGITGISRLGSSGYLKVASGKVVSVDSKPWLPEFSTKNVDDAIQSFDSLTTALAHYHLPISLGLSGGLDSRFLLAIMLSSHRDSFSVYTLGQMDHPDVDVATAIATNLQLNHQHIELPLPDPSTCIELMKLYAVQTQFIEGASTFSKLRYAESIRASGRFAVDGGFGEIGRRSLFKRLAKFGRKAIYAKDASQLAEILWLSRAPLFRPEVDRLMREAAIDELQEVLENMPSAEEIGLENFVDLFAVRTRIPNYGGFEQSRLDSEILNLTPFVQPSYIRTVINIPVKERMNNRFYNRVIRERAPELVKFPLVKGRTAYRFGLSNNMAWLVTRMKARFGATWSDPDPDQLFMHIKDPVLDLLHSTDVLTSSLYNAERIVSSVEAYYNGKKEFRSFVDWWLTFELWRRGMQGEK